MAVEVCGLDPCGECAACGLGVGQVILSIEGELVDSHEQAIGLLERASHCCSLVVEDGTRLLTLNKHEGFVGLTLADNPDGPGVVVVGLAPGSLAIHAGVQLGDVIRSVNHELVDDHASAIRLVDAPVDRLTLVLAAETAQLGDVLTAISSSSTAASSRRPSLSARSRPTSARSFIVSKFAPAAREPCRESNGATSVPYPPVSYASPSRSTCQL